MTPESHEKLAQDIDRTLRALPPRRAPFSLEHRVRAEIARRAALPWWRRSFTHWPLPVQAGFLALSALAVYAVLSLGGAIPAPAAGTLAGPLTWIEGGLAVGRSIAGVCETVVRSLPPLWLYGGLAFCAAAYAAVVGLGAAVWRNLQASGR
ncbi:MAG: hypothetical protein JNK23_11125 [Opitutaceae bacterium]|nr:hypothetical protein [Opitutaceae bacterium]